ncbi:MAG: T9SS type A sorting domain-containing protein [Salinivirgaceae bacterium]
MTINKRVGLRFVILGLLLFVSISNSKGQEESKKVFIHYMGWFGPNSYGRHWIDGQPREPIIGYYDSRDWSTQLYHILLSWSCGIDGLVINVKDSYDEKSLKILNSTFERILQIDHGFNFQYAVSYDDQGMNSIEDAVEAFSYLKNNLLPNTNSYLLYQNEPVVFVWNYGGYLSSSDYRQALDNVFTGSEPKMIWNEIDESVAQDVNSFYPWVQGFADDGSNWGNNYLSWFYNTIGGKTTLDFATGGVWAGFDERSCSWGYQERWIDRKDGEIYDNTWAYVMNYQGQLPLKWVIIETWNDWNEGTEIEPSKELGFQYLKQTIAKVNSFKSTLINTDEYNFQAATKIYEAGLSIENLERDSVIYYPLIKRAILSFIKNNCSGSIASSDSIIQGLLTGVTDHGISENNLKLDVYPNPSTSDVNLHFTLKETTGVRIDILDINGCWVETIYSGLLQAGNNSINWKPVDLKNGVYFCTLKTKDNKQFTKVILY